MFRVWNERLPAQMKLVVLAIRELYERVNEYGYRDSGVHPDGRLHLFYRMDTLRVYTGMTEREVRSWMTECERSGILRKCELEAEGDEVCYHIDDGEWAYTPTESVTEWALRQVGLSLDERELLCVMVQEYDLSKDAIEVAFDEIAPFLSSLDATNFQRLTASLVKKRVLSRDDAGQNETGTRWRIPYLESRRPPDGLPHGWISDHVMREKRRQQRLDPTQTALDIAQDLMDRGFDSNDPLPDWLFDEVDRFGPG